MAIMGTFAFEEDFLAAAKNLQSSGFDNISLLSPVPLEEAQQVLGLGKSPVRRFSLAGAIIGAISGFAMAVGTALVFILPTGGRAIITVPPTRETQGPPGITFSATTNTAMAATQIRFITPPTNSRPMSTQQQPRQYPPWSSPMRSAAPEPPPRQWNMMKLSGERQCLRHACLSGVSW